MIFFIYAFLVVSPAVSRGDTWGSLLRRSSVRPSVRPSVCLSVCMSVNHTFPVTLFYFANNSSSTDAIEMKHHMWIEF